MIEVGGQLSGTLWPGTLAFTPPFDQNREEVKMLLYFSDVDDCGGPTALVPRNFGADDPAYQYDESAFHSGIGPYPVRARKQRVIVFFTLRCLKDGPLLAVVERSSGDGAVL